MLSQRSRLSFGLVDGRPVFMDQQADSYFRLDDEREAEFLGLIGNENPFPQPSPALLDILGLAPGETVSEAHCDQPAASLLDERGTLRPTFWDLAKASLILHSARRSLDREPIGEILARLGPGGPAEAGPGAGRQLQLARRFLAVRPLVPVRTNCLIDSISILEWLGPAAAGALLVFAVKLDPFAAHCWVQTGHLLINDVIDNVAPFQPVRMIQCSAPGR